MLEELESLADLNGSLPLPLRLVNAHSGSDAWSEAEACEYFGALAPRALLVRVRVRAEA